MDREILLKTPHCTLLVGTPLIAERGAADELAKEGCGRDLFLGDGLEAIAATVSPC